jgi:hypothetical protein
MASRRSRRRFARRAPEIALVRTLAIDVGGSHLKAAVVDDSGHLLTERVRVDTPLGRPPRAIVVTLVRLVGPLGGYDRVSVGFPGVVRDGRLTPHLERPITRSARAKRTTRSWATPRASAWGTGSGTSG